MSLQAEREQVIAFRLQGHNLSERLPAGSLLKAAGACGIQNTPPGTAELALNARVSDLTPQDIDCALETNKTLLQGWSIRQSPYLFPTEDMALFTVGLLPRSEEAWQFLLPKLVPVAATAGMSLSEMFERLTLAAHEVLDGRVLTKGELSGEVGKRLPPEILPWCRPCASNHVNESQFRMLGLQGLFCFGPRKGSTISFTRTEQWLAAPLPDIEVDKARAELVRRYVHCYGPSTPKHFGDWAGLAPIDAQYSWQLIAAELHQVTFEGRETWLHQEDVSSFASPLPPARVRLLPPYDPYLSSRDRQTLLPDKALHPRVWQILGNPGVVLVAGEVVGLWRPQKKSKTFLLNVEAFAPLSQEVREVITAEAELIAPFKGCVAAKVSFASDS